VTLKPTPAFTGAPMADVHSNLSWLDAKGAFVTCQAQVASTDGSQTVTFEEFVVCLGLCGHIKYEEVEEMSLAQRVEGIIANYLGEKDEHAVITEAVAPPMERFDYKSSGADPRFVRTWAKMDLSHVAGFPLWEKDVFGLLSGSFEELASIFRQYSKMGSSGTTSAHAAETMQQIELTNLALDCGIASETFPMARVIQCFERADQVDDTLQVSAADRRVKTGQSAKGGDGSLELHEYLEMLVMLSFARSNPKYGEVGHSASIAVPLPGCLEQVMTKCLLQSAKRDAIAQYKDAIVEEPDVQVSLWTYKSALLKCFRDITARADRSSLGHRRTRALSAAGLPGHRTAPDASSLEASRSVRAGRALL